MRNLLRCGLARMGRGKVYWGELAVALGLVLFILVNSYCSSFLVDAYIFQLAAQFFGHAPLIGLFAAVFAAKLWGHGYEWGTLRNQLICGHSRKAVYLSRCLLCVLAAVSVTGVWLLCNLTLGVALLGMPWLAPGEMAAYVLSDLLMSAALGALCCLLSSLTVRESRALLLCLGAVAAMVIFGFVAHDRFAEPEVVLNSWTWWAEDPSVKWYPENPRYVGGAARVLLELAMCCFPGAQGVLLLEQDVEHLAFPALGSLAMAAVSTLVGLWGFKKKEIR